LVATAIKSTIDRTPDNYPASGSILAKLSGDHIPLGGFVSIKTGMGRTMNRSNKQRRPQPQPKRVARSPSDLAERFREWQRLRKQVEDIEQRTTQSTSELRGAENEKRRK
jgi:hypothetical protein